MRKPHALAVTAALACTCMLLPAAAASAAAPSATTAPGATVPDQDPFYAAPADIASYAAGAVVDSRPVPDVNLFGISVPVNAWQISYRTNDSHGRPELAVTTLVVPKAAWTGSGKRPVVSLQTPEDSVGTSCAPSYQIATGKDVQDAALGAQLLAANWAVAVPDFEGPASVFLAGPQAGHAVLDGIRAVKAFGAAGVGPSNPWALDGYSGGAEATGWAAQLQPSYAPDVRLAGAAIGGLPSDPAAVGRYIDGTAFAGFEFAAAYGIATEFPEAGIDGLLNAKGQKDFASIKGTCETNILPAYAFRKLNEDTSVADPFSVPSVAAVLRANTLGAVAPSTPVYDYHADTDEIVPVGQDDTTVDGWCAAGGTVQKVRDLLGEHVEEVVARAVSVQVFLADRFAGKPAGDNC
ncbi:putative lipase [Actinacidiphila reveromycinica]|uniref:Putative lipase n=1 Tax=Actinacidiphila reveromycinica TaxID=659352 RepID=A0A7U3UZ96_9ACTN|nr:lipase family protein [Streptomyces sp. SN-593]BBB01583.1 putative lipase [Streptomyces sp. SN-593]